MYGTADAMREDQGNLHKLDSMVTIAKRALNKILKRADSIDAYKLRDIKITAAEALLKIERVGK